MSPRPVSTVTLPRTAPHYTGIKESEWTKMRDWLDWSSSPPGSDRAERERTKPRLRRVYTNHGNKIVKIKIMTCNELNTKQKTVVGWLIKLSLHTYIHYAVCCAIIHSEATTCPPNSGFTLWTTFCQLKCNLDFIYDHYI